MMKTFLIFPGFILICVAFSFQLLANPLKKELPISESIFDDGDEHFHHYLNEWCNLEKPKKARNALHFFDRYSRSPFAAIMDRGEIWVTFGQSHDEFELPLNDDHLLFIDEAGLVHDKNGYHIPNRLLFDEDGSFKGYGSLKPDKNRAFGRGPDGRWIYRFFKCGHRWCRRLYR